MKNLNYNGIIKSVCTESQWGEHRTDGAFILTRNSTGTEVEQRKQFTQHSGRFKGRISGVANCFFIIAKAHASSLFYCSGM